MAAFSEPAANVEVCEQCSAGFKRISFREERRGADRARLLQGGVHPRARAEEPPAPPRVPAPVSAAAFPHTFSPGRGQAR